MLKSTLTHIFEKNKCTNLINLKIQGFQYSNFHEGLARSFRFLLNLECNLSLAQKVVYSLKIGIHTCTKLILKKWSSKPHSRVQSS